jgi:hypothetical protein
MAENSHLISKMPERETGLPNTYQPSYVSICPKCGYDTACGAWPEMGRDDEALGELVANWHCLMRSVRDAIMELLGCG